MAGIKKLFPVTIPTWPTCSDCLTWSEDDLAVAGGEVVYILTPKSSFSRAGIAGHPQWHILNLRVNLFQESEWPDIDLATIRDLSLGEEQSSSPTVAIAWSPSGIGMHRRSVLGVLTSNLILSLWETDGTQSNYHRTFIVNKSLTARSLTTNEGASRRSQRIRSFSWLPVLKTKSSSRWGFHYLVVADDDGNIVFLHATKERSSSLGHWSVSTKLQINHGDLDTGIDCSHMSPLQKRLRRQSPITKITVTPWTELKTTEKDYGGSIPNPTGSSVNIFLSTCTLTSCISTYTAQVCALIPEGGEPIALINFRNLQDHGPSLADVEIDRMTILSTTSRTKDHQEFVSSPESYFSETIRPLAEDFDRLFQLCGYIRTRFWGSAVSADGRKRAACISLHPSDMIEYSIPSVEKCTVVFRNAKTANGPAESIPETPSAVRIRILQFFLDRMRDEVDLSSPLDMKLHSVYSKVALLTSSVTSELKTSFEQIRSQKIPNDGYSDEDTETCEICGEKINFTSDIAEATCDSGHQFSRCHLSFLALQEPGISKYCSKCGKEFLDLVKLGPTQAMSTGLAQAIFDEFDVCPYCQGKFRG